MKAEKLAEKLAHVPTLSFASLNLETNGVPTALAAQLGEEKAWEGLWIFPATGGSGDSSTAEAVAPTRARRKAKLNELAKWIKKLAGVPFDAKAKGLPKLAWLLLELNPYPVVMITRYRPRGVVQGPLC